MAREVQLDQKIRQALESSEPVEELVAECLELDTEACEVLLAKLSDLQPALGSELRWRLAELQELGLSGHAPDWIPDRLGDFRLQERIGAGGMGVVYLAEQLSLSRRVALKLIRPGQLYFPGTRERFQREVRTIAQLQHPGIVPVYAVGEEQGIPYYAMRWIEGVSLQEVLQHFAGRDPERLRRSDLHEVLQVCQREPKPLDADALERALPGARWPEISLSIVLRIGEALHHAHERGVLHRDVKPSNIMLSTEGDVQLLDFGLASSEGASQLTRSGALVGTLPYMPPEQLRGSSAELDRRADVYALGVTLYELLGLRSPFLDESAERTRSRILSGSAPSLRALNRSVNWDTETVCMHALERDPKDRYATAADLASDLAHARDRLPIVARRPALWRRAMRWGQSHPGKSAALAALVLVALVALLFGANEKRLRLKLEQLSDVQRYRYLNQQADTFWPVDPSSLREMESWSEEVTDLVARLPLHRRALQELRERALPRSEEGVLKDRAPIVDRLSTLARELEGLIRFRRERGELDRPDLRAPLGPHEPGDFVIAGLTSKDGERRAQTITTLRGRIDSMIACAQRNPRLQEDQSQLIQFREHLREAEVQLEQRLSWWFTRDMESLQHDLLSELVSGLSELETRQSEVREQVTLAQALKATPEEVWARSRQAIREAPIYGGLVLPNQADLKPLGRNPQSGLWEFLLVASGSAPALSPTSEDPGRRLLTPDFGIILVLLPGGVFTMGNPEEAGKTDSVLRPHEVTLDPYFISKYEVTHSQARALGFQFEASVGPERDLLPAKLPWAEWRALLGPRGLDLPTEAQWEYGARGGTTSDFFTGAEASSLSGFALHSDASWASWNRSMNAKSAATAVPINLGAVRRTPVGSWLPNPFGLYDTIGNLAEWCLDQRVDRAYLTLLARPGDGLRATLMNTKERIVRGGNALSRTHEYRSYHRGHSALSAGRAARPVRAIR